MAISKTEERLSELEMTLQDFIRHTNRSFTQLHYAMIDLKHETADFRERTEKSMEEFKEEMRIDRKESKEEMNSFIERSEKSMKEFKEEMRIDREQLNKKWGELANKMGTLVEDIVAPNIIPLAEKYFGMQQEPEDFMVRRRKKHSKDKSLRREFDIIAVYEDKVFLNETKSTATSEYVNQFLQTIAVFFEFFPEYSGKELVPVFASLYINEDVVKYATKKGIYVMATKGDTMDILNFEEVGG